MLFLPACLLLLPSFLGRTSLLHFRFYLSQILNYYTSLAPAKEQTLSNAAFEGSLLLAEGVSEIVGTCWISRNCATKVSRDRFHWSTGLLKPCYARRE